MPSSSLVSGLPQGTIETGLLPLYYSALFCYPGTRDWKPNQLLFDDWLITLHWYKIGGWSALGSIRLRLGGIPFKKGGSLCKGRGRHGYQRVVLSWSRHIPLLSLPPSLKVRSPLNPNLWGDTRPENDFPIAVCLLDHWATIEDSCYRLDCCWRWSSPICVLDPVIIPAQKKIPLIYLSQRTRTETPLLLIRRFITANKIDGRFRSSSRTESPSPQKWKKWDDWRLACWLVLPLFPKLSLNNGEILSSSDYEIEKANLITFCFPAMGKEEMPGRHRFIATSGYSRRCFLTEPYESFALDLSPYKEGRREYGTLSVQHQEKKVGSKKLNWLENDALLYPRWKAYSSFFVFWESLTGES